ncbi:uncharacterized protein [Euwallacea fornicatus]|uniref:uncharacterized protein n=1 Tax=Euwallacea fornicatus TaxID=995702 RepID=UPI00338FCE18
MEVHLISCIITALCIVKAKGATQERYIGLSGCKIISNLIYECCATVNFAHTPESEYCINIKAVPNELTLNIEFKVNGQIFYNTKIDPGAAPICPTLSPVCLTVNYVNIASSQVCAKLTIGPITLLKFPCALIAEGQIVIQPNNFSK